MYTHAPNVIHKDHLYTNPDHHHHLHQNGSTHPSSLRPPHPQQQPTPQHSPNKQEKERVVVQAIPSIIIFNGQVVVGDAQSTSVRSYTPLKVVGDGSFGTVWLCDWHSTLPPNTMLSPMQCGAGARPEWAGKRLVAVKRMKKKWDGGWDECRQLKELESLRVIPPHPNIIPLYDYFLLPSTKELYFVFESMEGNLYQLIKSRKGRPLAGGLVSSIFHQIVLGLAHIHDSGYFHRDMKPENLLVTTTGLADYQPTSPLAMPGAPPEKDVMVIVKLADFGLARETKSKPPYTEYVSTRWYRAPEVLLRSRDYSNPVDMWALGTILAELVNLKPLFPGQGEIDQVNKIVEVLGDPSDEYGSDDRGAARGGGKWPRGLKLAKQVGFNFQKTKPINFHQLFDPSIPVSLIECIADLLKYEPEARLTSRQCVEHIYLIETMPRFAHPTTLQIPIHSGSNTSSKSSQVGALPSVPPRSVPPSHSQSPTHVKPAFNASIHVHSNAHPHPPIASSSNHRMPYLPGRRPSIAGASELVDELRRHDLPTADLASYGDRHARSNGASALSASGARSADRWQRSHHYHPHHHHPEKMPAPMEVTYEPPEARYAAPHGVGITEPGQPPPAANGAVGGATNGGAHQKSGVLGSLGLGKKPKWGFFGNGGDKPANPSVPILEEITFASRSTPSLKRTQSSSTDSRNSIEITPAAVVIQPVVMDPKKMKKEQERQEREAELARRANQKRQALERSRKVMRNKQMLEDSMGAAKDPLWVSSATSRAVAKTNVQRPNAPPPAPSTDARFINNSTSTNYLLAVKDDRDRKRKAPRRDTDDDVSMSSDAQSISRLSMISFATVDSDPGPGRMGNMRPQRLGISRATSSSSIRTTSARGLTPSPRSSHSNSLEPSQRSSNSLEAGFIVEFSERATFSPSSMPSPPPLHNLSLSPTQQPNWLPTDGYGTDSTTSSQQARRLGVPTYISLPPLEPMRSPHPGSPYEFNFASRSHPSSPNILPTSAINPIFQVTQHPPPRSAADPHSPQPSLPPFSRLASVADHHQPPPLPLQPPDPR